MAENVALNSCNDATISSPDFSVTLTKPNPFTGFMSAIMSTTSCLPSL